MPPVIFEKNKDLKIALCTFPGRNAGFSGAKCLHGGGWNEASACEFMALCSVTREPPWPALG